jgi:hypothetical protein
VSRRGPGVLTTEEKKRGRRLFGGLLSTLSQTNRNAARQPSKKLETERRHLERTVHKRADEDDKASVIKLADLSRLRQIAQIKFDEEVVSILLLKCCAGKSSQADFFSSSQMEQRHSAMLDQAHQLRTKERFVIVGCRRKITARGGSSANALRSTTCRANFCLIKKPLFIGKYKRPRT